MWSSIRRAGAALCVVGCIAFLAVEIAVLVDLFDFEFLPLYELIGARGVGVIVVLNLGLIALLYRATMCWRQVAPSYRRLTSAVIVIAAVGLIGLLQYMFMEMPITVTAVMRARSAAASPGELTESEDFSRFTLTRRAVTPEARATLRVMYDRIRLNSPQVYARFPIGETIDEYSQRYEVDPIFLFFRAYINSFYGEALSGRVPFFRTMTSETIRDVVQIHLPGWFVESKLRIFLIESPFFNRLVGDEAAFSLRYAVHKATLDVSTQPYDVSTFSDVFLVMKEYPEEFKDVLEAPSSDALRSNLKAAFTALRESALQAPYERPYMRPAYTAAYYASNRNQLKRFARSAYCLTVLDFTFATRIQALLSKYQTGFYRRAMGGDVWTGLPDWQRLVMLAMIRDLYTPNVGRPGYNVYALPELNCTPVDYVAGQARDASAELLGPTMHVIWRPPNAEYLWGGAGYQLRVMNDVWSAVNEKPIPGVGLESSYKEARGVLTAAGY